MKIWQTLRGTRFTCVTAGSWTGTHDRPARLSKHRLPAVAVSAPLLWIRRGCRGDDRATVDRRSTAVPGTKREVGRWWHDHGASGGTRRRSDEDRWDRRFVLLDRSRVVSLPPGPELTEVQG